uniref:Integrase n=1 Tax=Macrostomum lignano TaxID=282301 RepID=A0A1I8J0I9_9PLAT
MRLRPRVDSEGLWYTKKATDINTLGPMLKRISASAELSRPYLAHCLRPTVVTELHEARIPTDYREDKYIGEKVHQG